MPNLKQHLRRKLTKTELDKLRKAFDIVGDIAILEIPFELRNKKKIIAETVMDTHKNVKSVYVKKGGREGKYRLQKLQWLAGQKRTTTTAVENGVKLKLDVAQTYFSPRQSSERKRIYEQVKKKQDVLVMFSGTGPYAIEIAKHKNPRLVVGIEANKTAHNYAVENAAINKVDKLVKLHCGDVKRVMPAIRKNFDKIIMPLPKGAYDYVNLALKHAKKNAVIHYYDFLPAQDLPQAAKEKVKSAAEKAKKKIQIKKITKCGQLAPRAYRVCVDFKVV